MEIVILSPSFYLLQKCLLSYKFHHPATDTCLPPLERGPCRCPGSSVVQYLLVELQTIHRFSQSLSSLLPDVLLLVVHGEGLPPRVPDT